jgi:hypothetical protein
MIGALLGVHTNRTHAIINGWLDYTNHPNVGLVVARRMERSSHRARET